MISKKALIAALDKITQQLKFYDVISITKKNINVINPKFKVIIIGYNLVIIIGYNWFIIYLGPF